MTDPRQGDPHHPEPDPLRHAEVQQAGSVGYISGYVLTVVLLGVALLLSEQRGMQPQALLIAISGLAIFLLIAQCMLFFGLDVTRYNIWKSVSLVLTVPLFILSIGLTVWMFHSLNHLMMLPEMPGMPLQPTLLQ
jgi:cytochrome o ubiquinol oxidase operon protein cyoD